ncbi:MAG: FkbM family methyltransferase [Blastocatellia bacterium]|nr:FkbM family methyltransferase [Blastocatellia bacterium]
MKQQIRTYLARRLRVPEIPFALERLKKQGFEPPVIFDVGAYQGDFARDCLHHWPQAEIACFEPQQHKVIELEQWAATRTGIQVFPVLLGAQEQAEVILHEAETASSVLSEQRGPHHREVRHRMTTIDAVVAERFSRKPPRFLKLDVQGYEMEILKGAEQTLPQVEVLLAEVNLLDIHQGVPLMAEMLGWLNERDFVAFDICGLTRRPLDDALWQADMLFVPHNSPLRSDKRWNR